MNRVLATCLFSVVLADCSRLAFAEPAVSTAVSTPPGGAPHASPPEAATSRLTVDLTVGGRDAPLGQAGLSLTVHVARYLEVMAGLGYVFPELSEYGRPGHASYALGLRSPWRILPRLELTAGTGLSRFDGSRSEESAVPGLGVQATHRWEWRGGVAADAELGAAVLFGWGYMRVAAGSGVVLTDPSSCSVQSGVLWSSCASAPSPSYEREPGAVFRSYATLSFGVKLF